MKIRDHNQREINKFVSGSSEIFDEEMEQVFGKVDLAINSFSQSISFQGPSGMQKASSVRRF